MLARGAALRFLLTRLVDWLNVPPGALVAPKDPLEYLDKLRFHQRVVSARDYGLAARERATSRSGPTAPAPAIPAPAAGARSCASAATRRNCRGGEPLTTNNRMELMAAIAALEALKRPCAIELHTDSQYVRGGVTGWIHGWKRNGWRTADKKPVKNEELWRRLDEAARAPRDRLALGQGPRRRRDERTRRRAGARRAWRRFCRGRGRRRRSRGEADGSPLLSRFLFASLAPPARLRHSLGMSDAAAAGANAPEFSVSELSSALKRAVEDRFGYVRVRGEISGYRGPHSSGHVYFSLKDANARLDAVIWKGVYARMRVKPEEGLEVVAAGKITTFPGKSAYQIIVESLEPAGVGALMALLEARRRALAAEGLFDAARKQLLPYLPRVIGVVTSPTGAVIRDILHRLADRFPVHVLVWPVRVQGETSAAEVAQAIRGFNALRAGGAIPRPDLLIVARGGGSLEDLWSFNEEIVVRAAAESEIPLIAAVGHETDWTLIDHAADVRAPTPTAAAELGVPVRSELWRISPISTAGCGARRCASPSAGAPICARLRARCRRAKRSRPAAPAARRGAGGVALALSRRLRRARARRRASCRAASPANRRSARLAGLAERRRGLAQRLARARATLIERRADRLGVAARRLGAAAQGESRRRQERAASLGQIERRLRRALAEAQRRRGERLARAERMFEAVNYTSVLARGFALVRDAKGTPLLRAAADRARPSAAYPIRRRSRGQGRAGRRARDRAAGEARPAEGGQGRAGVAVLGRGGRAFPRKERRGGRLGLSRAAVLGAATRPAASQAGRNAPSQSATPRSCWNQPSSCWGLCCAPGRLRRSAPRVVQRHIIA